MQDINYCMTIMTPSIHCSPYSTANRPTLEIVRDRGYVRCGVGQPAYRASLGINDTSEIGRFALNMVSILYIML